MQPQQVFDSNKTPWRILFITILIVAMIIGLMTWLVMNREIEKIDKHLDEMDSPISSE